MPLKELSHRFDRLGIVLVEQTEQVIVQLRPVGDRLCKAQQMVMAGLRGEAPGKIEEVGGRARVRLPRSERGSPA
jgi:hypothetical protein